MNWWREGFAESYPVNPTWKFVGKCDAGEARRLVQELKPDLVVVDLCLPDASGLDLVRWIVEQQPEAKVIVSTMYDEREFGERVLRLGGRGFVNKGDAARSFLEAIRCVLRGDLYFTNEFTKQMLRRVACQPNALDGTTTSVLSDRELEVLALIAQGLTTKTIAERLFLSPNTIGTYRDRLKVKLNLKNSTELVHFAIHWFEEVQRFNQRRLRRLRPKTRCLTNLDQFVNVWTKGRSSPSQKSPFFFSCRNAKMLL